MKNIFVSSYRFYLVFLTIFLTFCTLGGRLLHLQVWQSERYTKLASNARKNFIQEEARRGDIVDRKGSLLATTRSVVVLGVDPHSFKVQDIPKLSRLANLLDVDVGFVEESVSKKFAHSEQDGSVKPIRWAKLKNEVDETTFRKILNLKIRWGLWKL